MGVALVGLVVSVCKFRTGVLRNGNWPGDSKLTFLLPDVYTLRAIGQDEFEDVVAARPTEEDTLPGIQRPSK
jgi:hypothetical protein